MLRQRSPSSCANKRRKGRVPLFTVGPDMRGSISVNLYTPSAVTLVVICLCTELYALKSQGMAVHLLRYRYVTVTYANKPGATTIAFNRRLGSGSFVCMRKLRARTYSYVAFSIPGSGENRGHVGVGGEHRRIDIQIHSAVFFSPCRGLKCAVCRNRIRSGMSMGK